MLSGKSLRVSAGRSIGMPSLRDEPTHSGSSLRRNARNGPAGRELRASAGRRLRAAAVPFGTANSAFKIQDSRFKIKKGLRTRLDIYSDSGRSLRRNARSGPAGRELRASAPGRLRPANCCAIEFAGDLANRNRNRNRNRDRDHDLGRPLAPAPPTGTKSLPRSPLPKPR